MRRPSEGRLGAFRAIGLSGATLLGMTGVVLAVNPGRFGALGLVGGLALLAAAATLVARLFVERG